MIGVTATGGAIIYYGRGDLQPLAAAPAVLGVQLGSWTALHVAQRASAKWLKLLMAALLVVVAVLMFARSGLVIAPGWTRCRGPRARHRGACCGRHVVMSSVCLAAGLLLTIAGTGGGLAGVLLPAGLFILIATPAARVVVSVVGIREGA